MQIINVWKKNRRFETTSTSEVNFGKFIIELWKIDNFEERYPFLSSVEEYGLTLLNHRQTTVIIKELEELLKESQSSDVLQEFEKFKRFADTENPDEYVLLIGD